MMLLFVGAVVLFCLGALLGGSWTTQALHGVSRRQAAERRKLNEGWRALEAARRSRGEPVSCARCHQALSQAGWLMVIPALAQDDDGT
jgi:hypothetical protein